MAVNHQIDIVPVNDVGELNVAKHPVLQGGLIAECRSGRRVVHHDDLEIRRKLRKGIVEAHRLPPSSDRERLGRPVMGQGGTLVRPETASVPPDTSETEPDSDLKNGNLPIKEGYAGTFERPSESGAAETPPVVIAEHRYHRQPNAPQGFCCRLDLRDPSSFGNVAGDDQHISSALECREILRNPDRDTGANMKISHGGDSYHALPAP